MQIKFHIHYVAHWGSSIHLCVHEQNEEGELVVQRHQMNYSPDSVWNYSLQLDDQTAKIHYHYELVDSHGKIVPEFGDYRTLHLPANVNQLDVRDAWRIPFGQRAFQSSLFKDCFFKRTDAKAIASKDGNFEIRLFAPQIQAHQHVAIVGNQHVIGNWTAQQKLDMDASNFPTWSVKLNASHIRFPLEYKFVVVDTLSGQVTAWEEGDNRRIERLSQADYHIINEEHFRTHLPSWRGTGVAIPVFSLRSKKSFGVGEFYDMKLMIDWVKKTGQQMLQILPVNDTTLTHSNTDSYPYNAVSVYALHPMYLRLDAMGKLKDSKRNAYYKQEQQKHNAKDFVDYQQLMEVKWEFFKEIYAETAEAIFQSAAYKKFFKANRSWLVPYAAFSYLRDKYTSADFTQWTEHAVYNEADIKKISSKRNKNYPQIAIYYFLQFHLDKQLTEVHDYAMQQGVAIKGDIPIGVSPHSADVWVEPELFNTHAQAGAPPDDFAVHGQNWSFPTYNWDKMALDGYAWWQKRFQHLEQYFDAYRIDHILGFFRIWEIPEQDVWALKGQFNPALPLTKNELAYRGLCWDEARFVKPYLREHVIEALFGAQKDVVLDKYFKKTAPYTYQFKSAFDTQKKIQQFFAAKKEVLTADEIKQRDGLYQLHCEVLFVEDNKQAGSYHPRISVQHTHSYRDLPESTKHVLDAIYNDFYYVRHNEFWKEEALKKLPTLIASNNMLVCGEDLGMLPDSVADVMHSLEILSLEIQRMPKRNDVEFAHPNHAPYLSVCSTSTHDMSPIRAWWEEDKHATQRFYQHLLGIHNDAPAHCEPEIASMIINQHLFSPAMWVILPWQDWMAIDGTLRKEDPCSERINVPSNAKHFWSYRMHMNLEDLLKAKALNEKIKSMIAISRGN